MPGLEIIAYIMALFIESVVAALVLGAVAVSTLEPGRGGITEVVLAVWAPPFVGALLLLVVTRWLDGATALWVVEIAAPVLALAGIGLASYRVVKLRRPESP